MPTFVCRFLQLFLFSGESHLANFNFSTKNKTSRNFSPDFSFFRKNYNFSKFGKKSQFLEKGGGANPISNNGRRNIISRTTFDSDLTVHLSQLFFKLKIKFINIYVFMIIKAKNRFSENFIKKL